MPSVLKNFSYMIHKNLWNSIHFVLIVELFAKWKSYSCRTIPRKGGEGRGRKREGREGIVL